MPRPGNFGGQDVTQDHSNVCRAGGAIGAAVGFLLAQAETVAAAARPPTNCRLFIIDPMLAAGSG